MAVLLALPFGLMVAATYPTAAAIVLAAVVGARVQRRYDARVRTRSGAERTGTSVGRR